MHHLLAISSFGANPPGEDAHLPSPPGLPPVNPVSKDKSRQLLLPHRTLLLDNRNLAAHLHRLRRYSLGHLRQCLSHRHIPNQGLTRSSPPPNSIFPSLAKCGIGWLIACLVVALYGLCIWSYSVAVFTDPGSPIEAVLSPHRPSLFLSLVLTWVWGQDNGYSYLPQWQPTSTNPSLHSNLTVKNDGRARYCQKCSYMKPDRTHHCSICKRCILKMDHHCPWLGNCIGFRNYKPFVLFLIYLTLFCFVCTVEAAVTLWYWISYVTPVNLPLPHPISPLSPVEVEETFAGSLLM